MINWEILGIAPTADKSAIKKAYRSRLAETNPEDKPEEFMALRQTYEEALEYAMEAGELAVARGKEDFPDGETETREDLLPAVHPACGWTRRLQDLYRSFSRRIQPENWSELAADPICTRIDTAADVQDALLRFLMEWWFVPDEAIRALDEVFHFEEKKEYLDTRYPKEFVDAILMTPLHRQGGGLEYHLFEGAPDADYDGFINLYYTLTGLVGRRENEEAWNCLEEMSRMGIYHPYLHVERAKLYLSEEKPELAAAEIEAVYPAFDTSAAICCMAGEVSLVEDDFSAAAERFTRALDAQEDSRWAKTGLAEACLGLKQFEDAQKWIDEVLIEDRYSPRGLALEDAIQQERRGHLEEKSACGDASDQERLDLSVIYIDQGQFREACQLLENFICTEKKDEAERLHYLATAQLSLEEQEKARENFRRAAEILQEILSVTSDPEEKEKQETNLARTIVMESVCLEELDQPEEALAAVTNVTIDYPELNVPFCRKAELHYELGQFQEAVDAADSSIALDDTFHLPYRIRANAFYELGHYNDAYEDCCQCIALYGGDIEAFFCKINILIEVGEFDAAFEELDELEEQVQGTQITFLRGKAFEASGNLEKARLTYRQVLDDAADKDREIYPAAEVKSTAGVYFRLTQVCRTLYQGVPVSPHQKECMEVLREGVRKHPADLDLLSDLAGELYIQSHHRDAQRFYERIAELDPSPLRYAHLAGNEIQMDQFDSALYHVQQALEMDPELIYGHILLGAVHTCRENYEEAMSHLNHAEELAACSDLPWPRILQDKSMIFARQGNIPQAIACLEENYRLYQKPDDFSAIMEMYRNTGRYEEAVEMGLAWLKEHPKDDRTFVLDEIKLSAICLGEESLLQACSDADSRVYDRNLYLGRYHMFRNPQDKDTLQQALQYLLEAEKGDPSSIHNLLQIATVYLKLEEDQMAREYAEKVLAQIPADFMDSGYQRSYYLARSSEALAILGRYEEAEARIQLALTGRKCDFCQYGGCIDAYCALVYMCLIRGDEAGAAKYQQEGLAYSPYDFDLLQYPKFFMKKEV